MSLASDEDADKIRTTKLSAAMDMIRENIATILL
jgi:hypothetical protein